MSDIELILCGMMLGNLKMGYSILSALIKPNSGILKEWKEYIVTIDKVLKNYEKEMKNE